MAEILRWPRHLRYNCRQQHEDGGWTCATCAGGLFLCVTCGAAEGELATECPGYRLEEYERAAVYNGHLDFQGGRWRRASTLACLTVEEIRQQDWYQPKEPEP